MIQTINKNLRIGMIIMFITLAFFTIYYKLDSCNTCKLEYNNETLDAQEFMNIYSGECLTNKEITYSTHQPDPSTLGNYNDLVALNQSNP